MSATESQLLAWSRQWSAEYDFALSNSGGNSIAFQKVVDRMPPLPAPKPKSLTPEIEHLRALAESAADGWGALDNEIDRYLRYNLSGEERRTKYGKPLEQALAEYGLYCPTSDGGTNGQ